MFLGLFYLSQTENEIEKTGGGGGYNAPLPDRQELRGCGNFLKICLTPGGWVEVLTNLWGYPIRTINLPDLQLGALMATAE